MEGLIVRIAALAAVACAVLGSGATASAAVAGLPDTQPAVSVVEQTAAAVAAPDDPPIHAAAAEPSSASPAAQAPAPPRLTATPASARPAPPPRVSAGAGHARPAAPARGPRGSAPGATRARHPGGTPKSRPHLSALRDRARGRAHSRPSRAPRRSPAPLRLPGAMGTAAAAVPSPDAFTAALLVAFAGALLPRLLRPIDDPRPPPQVVAFVSAIDRPG